MNPLIALQGYGQSFWYDNIRRQLLMDGTIADLIARDGLRGITSNPSIFAQAIGGSDDYDDQIEEMIARGMSHEAIYEGLAVADIRRACDLFSSVYRDSGGRNGFVSLEVSPYLAHDTEGTVSEARRLYEMVDRPNVMIKVPATAAGVPAIQRLISRGVNINVTLMFSLAHYEKVARSYLAGLEKLMAAGRDPKRVSSVASFFVSRVDTAVDEQLTALQSPIATRLVGKTAIANAKVVYQRFRQLFHSETFARFEEAGAAPQRLLWASTSTKNPAYPDTRYVDELIGPGTVNTMPPKTVEAFRDHGTVQATLEADLDAARQTLKTIAELGIDLNQTTAELQAAGVEAFVSSFDQLLDTLRRKAAMFMAGA
ncbi:MAG: transaldolase [Candidatus Promineifilaceae bacterium]|nr:transaldolase [Candidatus Promineifilaceae bacterium]